MFALLHTASLTFASSFNHPLESASSVTECVTLLGAQHCSLRSTALLAFSLLRFSLILF